MELLFVDTGAWCAYFNTADPWHTRVADTLEAWEERLVTTDYVFDELATLLLRRTSHKTAVLAGRALRSGRVALMVAIEPSDLESAWRQFERESDKRYSFTDCTSFAAMRRLGLTTAATLDNHFRQAGFHVLPESGG